MQAAGYDAFWSYTHDDNDRSSNRVLDLALALKNEYSLVTGDDLGVFIDRQNLQWGEAWRDRVNGAIGDVPFFIPIITPKYVRSEECRKEFLAFSSSAKSRGLDKLLLPILYIPISGLSEDSDDEMLALVARTQYVNWTQLRLLGPQDPRVLTAINELASRLSDLQSTARELLLIEEAKTSEEIDSDFDQTLLAIDERLERWMESVDFDRIAGKLWRATLEDRIARVQRLRDSHAVESAIFSTLIQLGKELLPVAQDRLEKSKNYARWTIEMDPLVNTAIRQVASNRARSPELNSLRDGVNEAYLNIEPLNPNDHGFGIPTSLINANKHIVEAAENVRQTYTFIKDANDIVLDWRKKLIELDGPELIPIARRG